MASRQSLTWDEAHLICQGPDLCKVPRWSKSYKRKSVYSKKQTIKQSEPASAVSRLIQAIEGALPAAGSLIKDLVLST